jgi:peptide deformylase
MSAKITHLGDPLLREIMPEVSRAELPSPRVREIIAKMKAMVESAKFGVGISANQIGARARISAIAIKPTPTRPNRARFEQLMINPEIVETFGRKVGVWEGCLSCSVPAGMLYGRVPRYKKIRVKFIDENGDSREAILTDLAAHVAQHELDHLNGVVFLDKVSRQSLMLADEYRARIVGTPRGNYYEREGK